MHSAHFNIFKETFEKKNPSIGMMALALAGGLGGGFGGGGFGGGSGGGGAFYAQTTQGGFLLVDANGNALG